MPVSRNHVAMLTDELHDITINQYLDHSPKYAEVCQVNKLSHSVFNLNDHFYAHLF